MGKDNRWTTTALMFMLLAAGQTWASPLPGDTNTPPAGECVPVEVDGQTTWLCPDPVELRDLLLDDDLVVVDPPVHEDDCECQQEDTGIPGDPPDDPGNDDEIIFRTCLP